MINSWKSPVKQLDKIDITIRISFLTILELKFDYSDKYFRFMILNLGYEKKKK